MAARLRKGVARGTYAAACPRERIISRGEGEGGGEAVLKVLKAAQGASRGASRGRVEKGRGED